MKKILLILALLPTLIFADAVIFSGNDVKALKQNLDLFGVVKILSGNLDPSVSGLPAPVGSQYNSTNGKVYVKKGVLDTQWEESQTGLINLSSDVSGVLPTSNGGTGSSNLGTGVVKASGGSLSSSSVVDADVDNAASINASKIGTGVVSNTEFNSLDGVSSPIQGQIDSKITGPASSTDNAIVRYDSTTGKLAKNSGVTIDDSNNVSGVANLTATGTTTLSTYLNGVGKFVAGVLSASTILNTDIASNAAIDYSKLAPLSTGQVLLGNAGVPTATTLSGGATVGATGVVTLGNSAVITQLLTGYASSPGTVSSADSIVQAIQKIDGNGKLKLGLTKSDSDGSPVTTTQLNVPNSQLTTSGTNTRRIETGNDNLLANPSFEHQTVGTGWTAINGSCAASSGVTIDGLKNCLFTSSGTNWSLSQCSTTNAPRFAGQEMENSIWLGSASTTDPIWVCPGTNGSYPTPSVANGCMQYTNIGGIQILKNYFLGDSASTSNCIRISGSNSGTTVGIDKAYTGLRTNSEVSGQLNTPYYPYTPTVSGNSNVTASMFQGRYGPNLKIYGKLSWSGAGTTAVPKIALPNSLSMRSDFFVGKVIGPVTMFDQGVQEYVGIAYVVSSTEIGFKRVYSTGASLPVGSDAQLPWTPGNNDFIDIPVLEIPIAGWENNINAFSTKCDDPRQCETVFSAKVSSTGIVSDESTDWINGSCTTSTGSQNFSTTCNFNSDIFKISPNCSFSIKKEFPWTSGVQSVTSTSIAYAVSNSGIGSSGVDAYLVCQKAGADYDRSRITQQIVQMREVPRTPGAVRTDIFGVRYTGGSATTACSTVGACTLLNPIGNVITSIAKTGTGNYLVTFSKNYINVSCTYTPTGAAYLGGQVNGFTSGTNTISIQSGISGGSVQDSFGTINCIGEY